MELGDVDVAYNLAIEGLLKVCHRPRCRFMLGGLHVGLSQGYICLGPKVHIAGQPKTGS